MVRRCGHLQRNTNLPACSSFRYCIDYVVRSGTALQQSERYIFVRIVCRPKNDFILAVGDRVRNSGKEENVALRRSERRKQAEKHNLLNTHVVNCCRRGILLSNYSQLT